MSEIIVGVYDSRRDAETARDRLVENGVDAGRVVIEEGPRPDQSALPPGDRFATRAVAQPRDDASTFVGRMFSGALIDDANVEHYTHALRDGKCVLAVRTNGADETRLATSLLARALNARRVVLWKDLQEAPIRDIALTRGLNIIW